jgi:hypothetical protein
VGSTVRSLMDVLALSRPPIGDAAVEELLALANIGIHIDSERVVPYANARLD